MPDVGALALAMLQSPERAPLSAILTVLLNDLASVAQGAPLVLILDDYHLIDDQAIHESVTFLLEHLPDNLHLVIAGRVDPDLPLSRWRVRGALLELRAADLRFSAAEASSFYNATLGEGLAEADVRLLEARTEGWIAGMQLAALAMRQRADRSAFVQAFTGSQRYLMDYVQEEILAHQGLGVQRFLLQTAVLTRMNAALCAALTQERNSQALLELLERNNLFVIPLDEQRQWYRMHDLFREVLLARLQATEPELVPLLHQRAAQWYAAHDNLREAVTHALLAADYSYAASLIERASEELWLNGEAKTVFSWIQGLPDAILLQHAHLALDAALHLLQSLHAVIKEVYTGAQIQVERTISRLEALLHNGEGASRGFGGEEPQPELSDAELTLIQRRIRLLRALMATRAVLTGGDVEGLRLLAEEAERLAKQEEMRWKMVALSISFALIDSLQRRGSVLIPRLLEAKQQVMQARDHRGAVRVMRWLAFAYVRAGKLRLVQQECLEALSLIDQIGQLTATAGYFYLSLYNAYYAWNWLDEAYGAVHQMLRIAHDWQQADLLIVGDLYLSTLSLASGDLPAADQALQRAKALVQREHFATHSAIVDAERVRYWLKAGDLEAASQWAETVVFSPERWDANRQWAFVQLVRVYLARRQYGEALEALERFSKHLDRPEDGFTTIEFLAVYVVALYHAGKREQAQQVAARLLALSEPEGFIRVYLDAGQPMKQLLQDLLSAQNDEHDILPAASIAFVRKLLLQFEKQAQATRMPAQTPQALALDEPLTPREQEVLHLLVNGASNQEIASQLVISLSTVKKHVSNILGKLGVESRIQVVARARDWSDLA
jgi:LuxR family maltose regulon positive regulatory protein